MTMGAINKTSLTVSFLWIPADLGGHTAAPYTGMRLSIRWQRYLSDYMKFARDVECYISQFDPTTSRGVALCTLSSAEAVPSEWLEQGELVELLNGFRVLAVGKIEDRKSQVLRHVAYKTFTPRENK